MVRHSVHETLLEVDGDDLGASLREFPGHRATQKPQSDHRESFHGHLRASEQPSDHTDPPTTVD